MKTLLQISVEVNSGSVGRIAEQIGQVAIANGWKSYITYARNNQPSTSKVIKIGTKWDIYWHGLQTRLFDNHCRASKNATRKLIKQIKEIKPDIIQLHHIHGYYLNMEILFRYLSSIDTPIVWIFHDCWSMTGHCAFFSYIKCFKWIEGCNKCPQKKSYPSSMFLDQSKNNYLIKKSLFTSINNMTIVTVSSWLGDLVKKSFFKNHQIKVIYNGVDTNCFHPNLSDIKNKFNLGDKIVLLGVATNWVHRKRLDDYILLNQLLSDRYVIVLIGLTTNQIKELPSGMLGIKRTESIDELSQWYSSADIVLNLSHEETFGLTTVEGFACGTPGIVYNCTASPELISNETGFIVELGDISGIVTSIEKIVHNGKGFYSENCRERAKSMFNKDIQYNEYITLYDNLINQL